MQSRKAFTLIELLVVIAIIAILAAILFPVFAQAKAAAKKTVDLSNTKQTALASILYGNDADDMLPDVPVFDSQSESYVFAAKVQPYTKSAGLWKDPASSYQVGAAQHGQVDWATVVGATVYMKAPDDPCVGLQKSKYETSGYSYTSTSNYYNDVYPPTDYAINADFWGYKGGGCPGGGLTGGYSHPGPNLTSGPTGGDGLNGIGGAGNGATFTSVAKAIMFIDGPPDNTWFSGSSTNGRAFWGASFVGVHNGQQNCAFFDGHAKSVSGSALHPDKLNDNDDHWKCANCSNAQYVSPASDAGILWMFWGTTMATPTYQ